MPASEEGVLVEQPSTELFRSGSHVHMIGIGGSGMSGAAAILLKLGVSVSGSDISPFEGLGILVGQGACVHVGHDEAHLNQNTDLVVISAAVPESNPELAAARLRGIPVIKYAQLLGELMRPKRGVAIAGTHGKSTTTAMCAYLLREAGLEPSFLFGARCDQLGGNSAVGAGPDFVVESCEYNRSFLHLKPELAAILNIEPDHLDFYRNLDEIIEAFAQFSAGVDPGGLLVCNAEDQGACRAAAAARAEVVTFGLEDGADWQAVGLRSDRNRFAFDAYFRGSKILTAKLAIPGRFNVSNALAAIALAYHAGADPQAIAQALATFAGVDRRLTWRGVGRGVLFVDDYAHHPTEIRVTIEAVRCRYRPRRMWIVFQPHLYSRTRYFMEAFAESLSQGDEVVVADVYSARETTSPATACVPQELVSRIKQLGGRAHYVPDLEAVVEFLSQRLVEGDLALTMGAGNIGRVADELVERFCGPNRARRTTGTDDVLSPGRPCPVPVPAA